MIDEYNLVEGDEGFIDGSMELGTESPLEMNENKNVRKISESQLHNLIYEITIKMLNEDDTMAAGAHPIGPMSAGGAAGATMDPMAAGGAVTPMPQATDADADGLTGKYLKIANDFKAKKAKEVGDNSGGAPGFNPQGMDDDKKKDIAKQVAESIIRQLTKEFSEKK